MLVDRDETVVAFFERHCAAGGVVLVTATNDDKESSRVAIFSTLAAAEAWTDRLGADWACVLSPYLIDEPEWGEGVRQ